MFSKSLSSIVKSFTKVQTELEAFVKNNDARCVKINEELRTRQREGERAGRILRQVKRFTEGE